MSNLAREILIQMPTQLVQVALSPYERGQAEIIVEIDGVQVRDKVDSGSSSDFQLALDGLQRVMLTRPDRVWTSRALAEGVLRMGGAEELVKIERWHLRGERAAALLARIDELAEILCLETEQQDES